MSLSMLATGTDCGPSNPLQGLSKRFDHDRGLQQDHFNPNRAGPSRETFRTPALSLKPDKDAAAFFSPVSSAAPISDTSYDVSSLRAALPAQNQLLPQFKPLNWASDFIVQQPHHVEPSITPSTDQPVTGHDITFPNINHTYERQNLTPYGPGQMGWYSNAGIRNVMFSLNKLSPTTKLPEPASQISWDNEFITQEIALNATLQSPEPLQQDENPAGKVNHDPSELARTAGLLLENIKHEQNPKFKKSQFMDLMRKLRDGDVIVEGNQMIENDGQHTTIDIKGKGRAFESTVPSRNMDFQGAPVTAFAEHAQRELRQLSQEDGNDAYFRQENAEYQRYWNSTQSTQPITVSHFPANSEAADWERLQSDWDQLEATSVGIKRVDSYRFQDNNPYLVGDSSATRHHMMHTHHRTLSESVLQLEAAVQRDMNNATAWFELGVKQQENERELHALQALKRATEIDPSHLGSWLALAISNTNESNGLATYDAINEWVNRNGRYQDVIQIFRAENILRSSASLRERFTHLTEILVMMARSNEGGAMDPDVQIALAIVLNTDEDYQKAQDCFLAALAARPDDWLLYNRVGATMANSGYGEDALQYYYKALELNPGYIRARFNLGISCINLRRYEEAAQHILDALVLQDNDGGGDSSGQKRGVTSVALWDSLKTACLHMQRVDLATLCDRQDLEGFRLNFYM